jgi:hypothetical protein
MTKPSSEDDAAFADRLSSMTNEELFAAMRELETQSGAFSKDQAGSEEVFARIALVEDKIEERYPGQALAPYKQWQRRIL